MHAAAEAGAKRAFVCAVDVPFLTADLIDVLVARAVEVDADVVLPWDGSDHYLAAVYRTELAAQVDALVAAGERNMRALVDRVDAQRIVISDPGRWPTSSRRPVCAPAAGRALTVDASFARSDLVRGGLANN